MLVEQSNTNLQEAVFVAEYAEFVARTNTPRRVQGANDQWITIPAWTDRKNLETLDLKYGKPLRQKMCEAGFDGAKISDIITRAHNYGLTLGMF